MGAQIPADPDELESALELGGPTANIGTHAGDFITPACTGQPHDAAEVIAEFRAGTVPSGRHHDITPAEVAFVAKRTAKRIQQIPLARSPLPFGRSKESNRSHRAPPRFDTK